MMTTTQLWLAVKRLIAQGILTKSDVGLPNVDNTSDANKPISTAVQSALNNKVDVVSGKGLSTNDYTTLEKDKLATIADNATANSSDATLLARANHTGTQTASTISDFNTATDARITAQKGVSSGLATLDGSGKVPSAQLPAYVDDVLEYADFASFPATGETGKLYIDLTDNTKTYRWSGSAYVAITGSPGSTDAVPEGSTNLYFTLNRVRDWVLTGLSTATNSAIVATDTLLVSLGKLQAQIDNKENTISSGTTSQYYRGDKTFQTLDKTAVGLSNVDNTSDINKPVSTAQQTALNAKANLSGGNTFTGSQKMSVTTLTYGATVTPDFSLNNLFTLTATGNLTLANPTNQTVGQGGAIRISHDGTITIAYGANWVFEGGTAPALTTGAAAVDRLDYLIMDTGEIHARLAKGVS